MSTQRLTPFLRKVAEEDNKISFEQNFYRLADALSKENFPALDPYDLGFQLIDKEKDNSKAFGVRAYRLKTLVFIPFFYDNGRVGGYELIYLPKQNIFLPNTPAWLSYLKHKDEYIGQPEDRYRSIYGDSYPLLLPLRRPIAMKLSSFIKAATTLGNDKYEYIVPKVIDNYKVATALVCLVDKYPFLAKRISEVYGPELLKKALAAAKPPVYSKLGIPLNVQKPALRFYSVADDTSTLTKEEIDLLNKQGYLVKDSRDKSELADVVPKISQNRFFVVNDPGIYKVLFHDGTLRTVAILKDLKRGVNLVVYRGRKIDTNKQPIYASEKYPEEMWNSFFNKLEPVGAKDISTPPGSLISNSDGPTYPYFVDKYGHTCEKSWNTSVLQGAGDKLLRKSDVLRNGGSDDIIVLPKNSKKIILRLSDYRLGNPTLLDRELLKVAHYVKLYFDENGFVLNNERLNKFGTLVRLMRDYNLSEERAKAIIREAELFKLARVYIKKAAPFNIHQEEQPSIVFPEKFPTAFAPGYKAEVGYEADFWVPGLKKPVPVLNIMDPPPLQAINVLTELSKKNDGEVFDLSLLSSLLYSSKSHEAIERCIPHLIKGLDSMGRIIFNMYRNKEALMEHYGNEDYTKILDELKTTFEKLGDLAVDLAQQKVDPYIKGLDVAESDVAGNLGEE